jgi:Flp pilus assembly protein TadG
MFASSDRPSQSGGKPSAWSPRLLQRFADNRSGNVAMMFGLLCVPICAVVGLGVDFGRAYQVRSQTQIALDAAALAAGRVAQVEKVDMVNKASAAASAYFNETKPPNVVQSTLQFSPNSSQTKFTVTATSWVRTPFLGVLKLMMPKSSDAAAPAGCQGNFFACVQMTTTSTAELKVGGNGETNIEVSLMLDVTGSMSGQKIVDLKSAANDLIDILVWDDQSQYTSRVAITPFAPTVYAGSTYFTALTNKADDPDPDGDGYNYPSTCYNSKGKLKNSCNGNSQYLAHKYAKCVVERTGTNEFTDAAPGANAWLPSYNDATGSSTTSCTPSVQIQPLTKDKTVLHNLVNNLSAGGSTAGQLGTALAWYMLSPKWSTVWPAASTPGNYGAAKLKKIAVLMTDGIYNTLQGTSYGDYSSQASSAASKARTLCTNMKAANVGIEIYTVGFDLGGDQGAINTLSQCATDSSHFYNTSTGDELRQAFRDIALKISTLRLTN